MMSIEDEFEFNKLNEPDIDIKHPEGLADYLVKTDDVCSKGNAVVHYWEYHDPLNLGHLSLTLSNGTHISFWPKKRKKIIGKRNLTRTLADDIIMEKRIPDGYEKISINLLKEDQIVTWWQRYKQNTEYNLVKHNCAITVMEALEAGEFGRYRVNLFSNLFKPSILARLLICFACIEACSCRGKCGECTTFPCICPCMCLCICLCMCSFMCDVCITKSLWYNKVLPKLTFQWVKKKNSQIYMYARFKTCLTSCYGMVSCCCPKFKEPEYEII
jgi:hypothetical protein